MSAKRSPAVFAHRPEDNQLVFTLPEALSEIAALRTQRTYLREALLALIFSADCGDFEGDDSEGLVTVSRKKMNAARAALSKAGL